MSVQPLKAATVEVISSETMVNLALISGLILNLLLVIAIIYLISKTAKLKKAMDTSKSLLQDQARKSLPNNR